MGYLDNLNTSQRAAVTAPLGPVSVLAGPGSGKTRVLTNRIQHLFYTHNFTPSRIRAVTFTQNGTRTMRQRLDSDGVRDVRISTFHSLCRHIIDNHYQRDPGARRTLRGCRRSDAFLLALVPTKRKSATSGLV